VEFGVVAKNERASLLLRGCTIACLPLQLLGSLSLHDSLLASVLSICLSPFSTSASGAVGKPVEQSFRQQIWLQIW
jgi:hypothetical protein